MTPFELWLQSLDPASLAKETFHSAEHRAEVARHEADKLQRFCAVKADEGRVEAHDRALEALGEFWALHDTPEVASVKARLSEQSDITTHRKEPVFTPEQIRIAQAVQERKAS